MIQRRSARFTTSTNDSTQISSFTTAIKNPTQNIFARPYHAAPDSDTMGDNVDDGDNTFELIVRSGTLIGKDEQGMHIRECRPSFRVRV